MSVLKGYSNRGLPYWNVKPLVRGLKKKVGQNPSQVGRREDTDCDEDEVDISVGVDVGTVAGNGVHGQGVHLGVGLGVGLVLGPPPSLPSTLREPV